MQKSSKMMSRVFVLLMQMTIEPGFTLPGGRLAEKRVDEALYYLTRHYGEAGPERIVDYCVCQVYRVSGFGADYLSKWKLSHSFGMKALTRFVTRNQGQKYYENRWLAGFGLTREDLLRHIEDRSVHPLFRFVYPDYEDATKRRAHSTEVGYYICGASTLLWTPFSPVCQACVKSEACKVRTQRLYPEIYRLRVTEFVGKEAGNE